jgi:glucosamine--fructose-6-phosphate aminotransferase (isomerizing)
MGLRDEIREQPALLSRWLDTQLDAARAVAEAIQQREIDYVFLAARGTSDHAGVYAQYLWGARNRLPVAFAAPSLFTRYDAESVPRLRNALVVGISQSGQSPDVVKVVEEGRQQGRPTVAFTNDPGSPLGRTAEHVFNLCETPEHAVAATKTYTTQLAGVALLGATVGRLNGHLEELQRLPEAMRRVLDEAAEPCRRAAAELKDVTRCLPTHGWSAADFRHGSIAMIVPGTPVLLIMPSGVGFADMQKLAQEVTDRGAVLTVISDDLAAAPMARYRIPLAAAVPEWLSPLTAVAVGQLLALELCLARGLDPDRPRWLGEKIVKTL